MCGPSLRNQQEAPGEGLGQTVIPRGPTHCFFSGPACGLRAECLVKPWTSSRGSQVRRLQMMLMAGVGRYFALLKFPRN